MKIRSVTAKYITAENKIRHRAVALCLILIRGFHESMAFMECDLV